MIKKGEVVTLVIFVLGAILLSSVLTGYVYELKGKYTDDGEQGSMITEVEMGFYDDQGNLIRAGSLLPFKLLTSEGDPVSYFDLIVRSITIKGEGLDPNSLDVEIWLKIDKPSQGIKLASATLDETNFDIQGDKTKFTATSKGSLVWTKREYLIPLGDDIGLNYKQSTEWPFRCKIEAECEGFEVARDYELSLKTKWQTQEKSLTIDSDIDRSKVQSIIPSDVTGLSLTFGLVLVFFTFWYKWGRKLFTWD